MSLPGKRHDLLATSGKLGRATHRLAATATCCLAFCVAGCATAPVRPSIDYGRYPEDCESTIERTVQQNPPASSGTIRTVTSVSDPNQEVRKDVAGWGVWARIRETRPTPAGGVELQEREYHFLLRGDQIVASDYPNFNRGSQSQSR